MTKRIGWIRTDRPAAAWRGRLLARIAMVVPTVALGAFALASPASAGLGKPVITFDSPPSPAEGATLAAGSVQYGFTYNRAPKQTEAVSCVLSGPTGFTGPCVAPVAAGGGSKSGVSYNGLANGAYALTVTVTLTDGGTVAATRDFTVAASSCTAGTENFNEDTVGTDPATFTGGIMSGYSNSGGVGLDNGVYASSAYPGAGFTDNVVDTGKGNTSFMVTFTNPVKSLSLTAASLADFFNGGSDEPVTLTAYDALNDVVNSASSDAGAATSFSITSSTANIAYFTFTEPALPAPDGVAFTDMAWGC